MLICNNVEEWLQPKGAEYPGLLVQRPQYRHGLQQIVDKLARLRVFGDEETVAEEVAITRDRKTNKGLAPDLSKKAHHLISLAVRHGLPKDLGCQIQQDCEQIGKVLANLVPTAKRLFLKLDIVGENSCSRWHRDRYVGRAVVSYNCTGTKYVDTDVVNLKSLESRGETAPIIQDESQVLYAQLGDILFMKGTEFPTSPKGLVHSAPEKCWHADGSVKNRLLLKVDLPPEYPVKAHQH